MADKVADGIEASYIDFWYFCFWKDSYRYTGRRYLESLFDGSPAKTSDTKLANSSRLVVLQPLIEWIEK